MRCQAAQLSLVLRRRRPLPVGRLSLSLCLAFGGGGMAPPAMDLVPFDDVRSTAPTNVPWAEMFRSASARRPPPPAPNPPPPPPPPPPKPERSQQELQRLALYVAMAHAGLAFCVLLFYGLYRLLQDFIRPIQWAVLCSIPLREIQTALVSFWAEPLASGPATTLLAVPAAAFRLSAATVLDLRSLFLRRRRPRIHKRRFRQLLRWLASFAVFVLAYERLGATAILLFSSVLLVADPAAAAFHDTSFSYRRRPAARRLETLVAAGLIAGMLGGAALGGSFFSYKIAMESKDAVVAVKAHVRSSNYAERIGFRRWMEENDISGKVDMYTAMAYGAALDQVDGLAAQYNLTDLAAELKHLIMLYGPVTSDAPAAALVASGRLPITEKLRSITAQVKNREWGGIYEEMSLVVEELQRSRADLVGKAKRVAQNIVAGSKTVVGGGAGVILSLGLAVVSGAGEVLNFVSQATVFVWVLYYLITAESGGVTEQVVAMLPASDAVRARCVEVIDKAISNVLLATAKIAIFQGCLTWLLFRLCSVHFLYVSTVLAAASPLMPFLPTWLSTVPAAAQLAVEKKYVGAAVLSLAHLTLMGLGVSAIQQDIPGYNEYLTGLSIIGGMALFPSAFEGAIMGPLIMTVVIAVKNLYVEFVLGDQAAGEQPSSSSSAP